jgi:Glycosyl hydrolase 2 galactose-binding domain-like
MPHLIRLREPWEREPLESLGAVRFTRHFHRPTGLGAASRVWLVIENIDSRAAVTLNDRLLGEIEDWPARFEITADLLPRNLLAIDVSSPAMLGAVRLEIDDSDG